MEWWSDLGWWIDISEIARNFGLILAGLLALLIAWFRVRAANRQADAAIEQSEIARRTHVVEVFTEAVGLLQNDKDKLEVRLGAIFTLRQVAADFPSFRGHVIEVLTAYLRGRTQDISSAEADVPPDIRAITEMLQSSLDEG